MIQNRDMRLHNAVIIIIIIHALKKDSIFGFPLNGISNSSVNYTTLLNTLPFDSKNIVRVHRLSYINF